MKRRLQAWRPLTLCWARPLRPMTSSIARTTLHATHQHHHATVHLHFALHAQQRPELTGPAVQMTTVGPGTRLVNATHTEHRSLTLHHIHTNTSHVQRTANSLLDRRVERVHTVTTTNVTAQSARSAIESLSTPAPRSKSSTGEVASPPPSPRPRALMTLATPSKELRPAALPQPPANKPLRTPATLPPIVWRKSPSPAPDQPDDHAALDVDSSTVPTRSNTTSSTSATTLPAFTPQQAREAVRANLLDGAVVDRLADDVIRRVEKRLRIERERRGL